MPGIECVRETKPSIDGIYIRTSVIL